MEVRYYICKHCGNIVEKVKDKGVPVICCGEPMQELKAGVTDAAVEKHVPVYTVEGSCLLYTSLTNLMNDIIMGPPQISMDPVGFRIIDPEYIDIMITGHQQSMFADLEEKLES